MHELRSTDTCAFWERSSRPIRIAACRRNRRGVISGTRLPTMSSSMGTNAAGIRNHEWLIKPHCHPERSDGTFSAPTKALARGGGFCRFHRFLSVGARVGARKARSAALFRESSRSKNGPKRQENGPKTVIPHRAPPGDRQGNGRTWFHRTATAASGPGSASMQAGRRFPRVLPLCPHTPLSENRLRTSHVDSGKGRRRAGSCAPPCTLAPKTPIRGNGRDFLRRSRPSIRGPLSRMRRQAGPLSTGFRLFQTYLRPLAPRATANSTQPELRRRFAAKQSSRVTQSHIEG